MRRNKEERKTYNHVLYLIFLCVKYHIQTSTSVRVIRAKMAPPVWMASTSLPARVLLDLLDSSVTRVRRSTYLAQFQKIFRYSRHII